MASQFALILDAVPESVCGPRRGRITHLTCRACGAHHAIPLLAGDGPTHQCRDCGHQWVEPSSPSRLAE